MSVKRYQPVAQCVEPSYQAQMIEPKVMEFSEGEYVRWEDYDATCETLAHTETERDASDAEVERLKAEVERLRKWMDDIFLDTEGRLDSGLNVGWTLLKIKQEYNAAKEGKQPEEVLWVQLEDYEKLKAEVERLRQFNDEAMAHIAKEERKAQMRQEGLEAEVERLRKAGDEVIHEWSSGHGTDVENFTKALWVWAVAKEGKQS